MACSPGEAARCGTSFALLRSRASPGAQELVEVRPEPALGLFDRNLPPARIFLELVAADASDAKILAVAVPEIEAGDGRSRQHCEILGQGDFAGIAAQHLEQHGFQAVIGACRIARCRPDSVEVLPNEIGVGEMLVCIAPEA